MSGRVTWLLPVKDGMPYLPDTLASIEAQTYRDWEILVWDNGSTDGTVEELNRWIPSRLPGRVVTGRPLSLAASLRELVSEAETDFCARIDADDVNAPDRLERQVIFLRENLTVGVVGSQYNSMDSSGGVEGVKYRLPSEHDDIVHAMMFDNPIAHPSVLFRRSAVLQAGNYCHPQPVEDYDLWLRMARHCKMANLDTPLINYRFHDQSYTRIAIRERRLAAAMDACFSENAPPLYGCTREEALLLRQCRHRFAVVPLYRIARYLHRSRQGPLSDTLRSDSFIHASRHLIAPGDIVSRLVLVALDRRKAALAARVVARLGKRRVA